MAVIKYKIWNKLLRIGFIFKKILFNFKFFQGVSIL